MISTQGTHLHPAQLSRLVGAPRDTAGAHARAVEGNGNILSQGQGRNLAHLRAFALRKVWHRCSCQRPYFNQLHPRCPTALPRRRDSGAMIHCLPHTLPKMSSACAFRCSLGKTFLVCCCWPFPPELLSILIPNSQTCHRVSTAGCDGGSGRMEV